MDRYMLFPSGMGQHQNGSYVLFADAQATIAALQARVKELCKFRQADHEQLVEVQKYWRESQDEVHELQSQLTQRTAERDALKLVNDTHMKTVMKLSHVVEQRTAELEAANKLLYRKNCALGRAETIINDLQAELERVRGERDAANRHVKFLVATRLPDGQFSLDMKKYHAAHRCEKHRDDPWQDIDTEIDCFVCLKSAFTTLRTLIAALPKVEGKIEVHTFKNTNQVVVTYNRGIIIGTLYGLDHAKPVAALYEHRQGMEG